MGSVTSQLNFVRARIWWPRPFSGCLCLSPSDLHVFMRLRRHLDHALHHLSLLCPALFRLEFLPSRIVRPIGSLNPINSKGSPLALPTPPRIFACNGSPIERTVRMASGRKTNKNGGLSPLMSPAQIVICRLEQSGAPIIPARPHNGRRIHRNFQWLGCATQQSAARGISRDAY